ncbi:DoxX family protein [Pseudoflavitalea sp. X16]|uniref:DoxX family protein n=1 Tax=Paraflavitalea devenefica TaxID=2716334 RepID=UPI0014220291|nr:DoxX family protein [Paraflavitalea devenefica]NII26540.1 DoxX family protein [Paraflavitalea devenefica]
MKITKIKIAYWIVLVFITIGMLFSAVPSVLKLPYAVEHFCNVLKLPEYLLVFTGVIKIIGLITLYIPGYPRLKEWIFAGFTFDLIGAWYCNYSGLNSFAGTLPVLVYLLILFVLYYLYHRIHPTTK